MFDRGSAKFRFQSALRFATHSVIAPQVCGNTDLTSKRDLAKVAGHNEIIRCAVGWALPTI
jgi:hypothetical protein